MPRATLLFLVSVSVFAPARALAYINLSSDGGYLFDFADVSDSGAAGSVWNGTRDAYDTCYSLTVGGTVYDPPSGAATTSLSGRQLEFPAQAIAGLTVRRIAWVPAAGGDFARFLEVLENTGASPITTTVLISGNLGSDSGTTIVGSSSGDLLVTSADLWFATDDASDGDVSGDPSLAHVFSGTSSSITPTMVSSSSDTLRYQWSVTVPAGGRVALLHFAVQTRDRATALTFARLLVEAPDDALVGLDDYLDDIQNFGVSAPGAPRVRFEGPFSADEGDAIVLELTIEDLEGDTFSHSWDLDGDGTFGEAPGAMRYTVAAGTTDGPGAVRVGVRATDAEGNVAERYRAVQIRNVAPVITSDPPLGTSVGASYRYQVVADEPAGALDALAFTLMAGPARMVVSPTGLVQWTPGVSDVTLPGETLRVQVQIADGDEGTDVQAWELSVSPNRVPTPPTPAFPIERVAILDRTPRLAAGNAEDLDLDPLTYRFELDTVDTFDSPALRTSGPLAETPGFTAWQLEEPLEEDRRYHWRVRANDGNVDSEPRQATFYVVRDPSLGPPDAGPPERDGAVIGGDAGLIPGLDAGLGGGGGGCSVAASSQRGAGALALLLVALALFVRRR